MKADSSIRPKRQEDTISLLNAAIKFLNLAKGLSDIPLATYAFSSVSIVLEMIRVSLDSPRFSSSDYSLRYTQDVMINQGDYVELGLICVEVCRALSRGLDGKRLSDLSDTVCEAIMQLTG